MTITKDEDLLFFRKVLQNFVLSASAPDDKYAYWDKQKACFFVKKINEDIAKNHNEGVKDNVDIF